MRIHIPMNGNTFPYFEYCVQNHKRLATNPSALEFFAYSLDAGGAAKASAMGYNAIKVTDSSAGTLGHALGIEAILKNLKNGDINVISDSDCIVLYKNWDDAIAKLMMTNGIIGTTFEDIGGFSSGTTKVQTYKGLPNVAWVALSPKYDWQFDTSCNKDVHLQIDSQELSETFNLPIGYSLLREHTWKLPFYLRENKVVHYNFNFVRPTSGKAKAVLTGEDYHTEYTLHDGTPFVAHQRGSMSKTFRVHHLSKTFYDACEAYINASA